MADSLYQSEEERRLIEARLAAIEARYGDRLDAAARELILARLLEDHRRAAALRRAPLAPADEPLSRFAPRAAGEQP